LAKGAGFVVWISRDLQEELLLVGALGLQMPYRFQALEQPLHFLFVLAPKNWIAERERPVLIGCLWWRILGWLAGSGNGGKFSPKFTIRNTVEKSLPREAAEMPQQAARGVQISGIEKMYALAVMQSQNYHQRRNPHCLIHPSNVAPGNRAPPDSEMRLVDFDGRSDCHRGQH
jgi:hypothetical protein